jgi:hypothetical protein
MADVHCTVYNLFSSTLSVVQAVLRNHEFSEVIYTTTQFYTKNDACYLNVFYMNL